MKNYYCKSAKAFIIAVVSLAGAAFGGATPADVISAGSSNTVNVVFNAQYGGPMPESTTIIVATNATDGGLAGHHKPIGYISFWFMASDCTPSVLRLCVNCQSGRQWYRTLDATGPGNWRQYVVPMNYAGGWSIGPWKTLTQFQNDLTDVVSVGLYIARAGNADAQHYTAIDFALQGPEWGAMDSDGDGICNADEIAARTSPFDQSSLLMIRSSAAAVPGGGFCLTWDSTAGSLYTVWRGTNLVQWLTRQAGIPAQLPQNYYLDADATGAGPYYYQVTVDNPAQ